MSVSITPKNTVKYPLHQHNAWEIMYYLDGSGYLATAQGNIPYENGDIIIVPPRIVHGSASNGGFVNISVGGDFNNLFMFDKPVRLCDNKEREGEQLARLIYKNRYSNNEYLSALCNAYAGFLLNNFDYDNRINRTVAQIIKQIGERFTDTAFDVTNVLKNSGYAEDYIRAEFKRITGFTPIQFLTKTRIQHAYKLLEIYGDTISVSQAAESCGFDDVVYFSKRFKQFMGISPDGCKKRHIPEISGNNMFGVK